MFIENLPEENLLKIFNLVSRRDKMWITLVCKKFHRIVLDALEIKKYPVGDVSLIITKNQKRWFYPYTLCMFQNGKDIPESLEWFSSPRAHNLMETMQKGTLALIESLKKSGMIASKNAEILEEEFEKENQTVQSSTPRIAP